MEKVVLKASKRDVVGKKVGALRRQGKLPAVLYGRNLEATAIMLDAREGSQTLSHLTSSSLVTINLEGKEYLTLVKERQRDFLKNRLVHLDFNAVMVTGLTEIEVECLPADLPERIVVDISGLDKIGDSVRVRDVVLSDKVAILDDPEEIIAIASPTKEEPVIEAAPAEAEEEAAPEATEGGEKEKD
jgi:large subunit ribosomal protein L25